MAIPGAHKDSSDSNWISRAGNPTPENPNPEFQIFRGAHTKHSKISPPHSAGSPNRPGAPASEPRCLLGWPQAATSPDEAPVHVVGPCSLTSSELVPYPNPKELRFKHIVVVVVESCIQQLSGCLVVCLAQYTAINNTAPHGEELPIHFARTGGNDNRWVGILRF